MDETEETRKDSLQETGQASKGSEGTTSKADAKTYTESELNKAVSDALSHAGRTAQQLEEKEASLNAQQAEIDAAQAKINKIQEQIDETELDSAQVDPTKLKELITKLKGQQAALKEQQAALRKGQGELNRDKAEHEAELKAAREETLALEIWKIAQAEGIDHVELKDTMKDLNLTTVEQAKSLAKRLAKKPQAETTEKKSPDSLVTSGGQKTVEGKSARQIYADNFRNRK